MVVFIKGESVYLIILVEFWLILERGIENCCWSLIMLMRVPSQCMHIRTHDMIKTSMINFSYYFVSAISRERISICHWFVKGKLFMFEIILYMLWFFSPCCFMFLMKYKKGEKYMVSFYIRENYIHMLLGFLFHQTEKIVSFL